MTPDEFITRHEGRRNQLYRDSLGLWTIGIGRLLDPSKGAKLSDDEVDYLFNNDLARVRSYCREYIWFAALSQPRQTAMLDLMFNLGPDNLAKFHHFLDAMATGNYDQAANELVSSKWYTEVGRRGPEVVNLIRNETWPV